MIYRLTDAALKTIVFAEDQTRGTGQPLDLVHVLVGSLSTKCDAVFIMNDLGVEAEEAVDQMKLLVKDVPIESGNLCNSRATKRVLRLACSHADKRGSKTVNTADLLMGILQCCTGAEVDLLKEMGFSEDAVSKAMSTRIFSERQTEFPRHVYGEDGIPLPDRDFLLSTIAFLEKLEFSGKADQESRHALSIFRSYLRVLDSIGRDDS